MRYFDIVESGIHTDKPTGEDYLEVVFEEKNTLLEGYSKEEYESKDFFDKRVQGFPLRGKAVSYLEFNYLVEISFAMVTDSGGITEETTVMGVPPCLTLRDNTERPETITVGTNELIGTDPKNISPSMKTLFAREWKKGGVPELWDGKTEERIVEKLIQLRDIL